MAHVEQSGVRFKQAMCIRGEINVASSCGPGLPSQKRGLPFWLLKGGCR